MLRFIHYMDNLARREQLKPRRFDSNPSSHGCYRKQIIFIDFSTKRTSYNSPNEHIQFYFQILSEYLALQLNLCQSTALDLRKIKQRHYTILGIHTVFLVQFEINLQKWAFGKTHKWKSIANWTRKIVWLLINNINMKNLLRGSAGRSFLSLFYPSKNTHFKISAQRFCYHFTWHHWFGKIN